MATIRDVARSAGVSVSTVSLALNHSSRVSPETRERVLQAAKATGYAADPVAQSLKSGKSRLIAMVVADITNPFFGRVLREVERQALARNYMVILSDSRGSIENEKEILHHLRAQRVAGIVLSPSGRCEAEFEHIRALAIPFVMFDHKIPDLAVDFVGTDNVLACSMITEHILRFGHRRVAYIGGIPGLYTAEMRKRGFLETMAANGVEADPSLVVAGDYDGDIAYGQTLRLLTRPDRPTAIVTASNVMGLGALQAMNDLRFRCPEDISIASIDDVPWSNVIKPRVTVSVQLVEQMASIAAGWLMERIQWRGERPLPPRDHIETPRLVVGGSTAPPGG